MRLLVAAFALMTLATIPLAQRAAPISPPPVTVLQPGDARLDPARLQPYRARWRETLVNAINQVIERGSWDDELTREMQNGRAVLTRTIVVTQPDGKMRERYRMTLDASTLEPIRAEWQNGAGQSYTYDYALPSVKGVRVNAAGGVAVNITATVPSKAFDYYAGMMELFLATLPRERGLYTFPALLTTSGAEADQQGVDWPRVEVFPAEQARGAGGQPVTARRIEANTKYGFYKVWVIDTPPFVVRTVLLLGPGGRITYELWPS